MSWTAFLNGVQGLETQTQKLNVISTNIANVNTTGYKERELEFGTLLSEAVQRSKHLPRNQSVDTTDIIHPEKSGVVLSSEASTDLAVAGRGLFTVNDAAGNTFYTRDGSFRFDSAGKLVNKDGMVLRVFPVTSGVTGAGLVDAQINRETFASTGEATTLVRLGATLPATAATGTAHSLVVPVFDSAGNRREINATFTKAAAANTWNVGFSTSVAGATLTPAATTSVDFGANGFTQVPSTIAVTGTFGANTSAFTFDMTRITQVDASFQLINQDINGFGAGQFKSFAFDRDGFGVVGLTNGAEVKAFQVPLALFQGVDKLKEVNGPYFKETKASGSPTTTVHLSRGAGRIIPQALERSNVDLGDMFTQLIITQKTYSFNTKVVTTADRMIEVATELKR